MDLVENASEVVVEKAWNFVSSMGRSERVWRPMWALESFVRGFVWCFWTGFRDFGSGGGWISIMMGRSWVK